MLNKLINCILCVWVVYTTDSKKEFEKKLNSLPPYVVSDESTKILQSGNWPKYTIIYREK